MRHLTSEAILGIHDAISKKPTGEFNIQALRETVEEVLKVDEYGSDVYPEIFTRAAAYIRCISQLKPFVPENNARTAWAVAVAFLHYNGVAVFAEHGDIMKLTDRAACGSWEEAEIVEFLYERAVFRNEDPPSRRGLWDHGD